MTATAGDRMLLDRLAEQARHWQDVDDLREHTAGLRARQNQRNEHQEQQVMEQFTEFAVRVTLPGYSPRIIPCATFERDAIRAYDHEAALHGEETVEFLMRQVRRTEWVAGKLPKPVERDDGPRIPAPAAPACGETLYEKPIRDVPTGGKL